MTDDPMDELLIHSVRDYNAPAAVPRDEMWERIRQARAAAAAPAAAPRHGWRWAVGSIAAAAVLAIGIGIGRRMQQVQPAPSPAPTIARASTQAPAPITAPGDSTDAIVSKLRQETHNTNDRVRTLAAATPSRTPAGVGQSRGLRGSSALSDNESTSLAYRLVVLQHLAGTEAMITTFRASAKRGVVDAQIAGWSRELLSTTRMLEASTASNDPVMRRLLEDLDLVIVQILQYSTHGTVNPDELDLIEQSITKRGVITKLRSTLPRRALSAGT